MYAGVTFPFGYAQTQTFPSYKSSSYGPASTYNPASAFRSPPFGGYVLPVPNTFGARYSRANPLNGPPPNFGVFERQRSPAQGSTQAYTGPRHDPIAHSGFMKSSVWSMNPQTSSPGNRVYTSPLPVAAPVPRFPFNFIPSSIDAVQRTPPASPRFNLGTSAASPVARMPQAETSHETSANRDRPVFTNPFDNNKVILEDTWSELGSTTIRRDIVLVKNPKHEVASGSRLKD